MPKLTATELMLAGVAYLLVKHAIADFFLQTRYQWANKGRYGHPGGLLHVAIHGALSLPVLLILVPQSAGDAATVLAAEAFVHYHCDWIKEQVVKRWGWTPATDGFWRAMGVDQLVHGLTYVGMAWALASGV
jgi:Protein of unknown function (DUF3307)